MSTFILPATQSSNILASLESIISGEELTKMESYKIHGNGVYAKGIEGGLGVIGLKSHNEALMMKKLYKFFNRLDIPMVGIIW